MRRKIAPFVALGFGLVSSEALAQQPTTGSRSPVRISAIRTDDAGTLARAQSPAVPGGSPMQPLPPMGPIPSPMPMPPMGGTPMPMGTGSAPTQLGAPRSMGAGPRIVEDSGTGSAPALVLPTAPPVAGNGVPSVPYYPQSFPQHYPQESIPSYAPQGVTLGPAYNLGAEGAHPTQPYPQTVCQPESVGYPKPHLDAPLFENVFPRMGGGYGCPPAAVATPPSFGGLLACGPFCGQNRWWTSAEYLLWFTKSAEFPALVTTSSSASNGIANAPDTRVLFGNDSFGQTLHSGGRFSVGRYFGQDQRWGLDGSIFFLGTNNEEFTASSAQFPLLARPFTNLNQNVSFSQIVTKPGLSTGGVGINFENSVWGADLNLRRRLAGTQCSRLDLITGLRFMQLSEQLNITESFARTLPVSDTSIGVPNAVSGTVMDRFRTENNFFGGTFGLSGEIRRGRWFSNLTTKVALGSVYQQVMINGAQNIRFDNGSVQQFTGGLLALPGNIGTHTQNRFAVVPEVGLNIGYHVTPNCRIFLGYSMLYMSSVLRPGEQIDTGLDVTRIPNFPVPNASPLSVGRPSVPLRDRDFFAQGLNFGLQWRW